MKKLFLMLFAVSAFTACDSGDDGAPKEITVVPGSNLDQIVYADDTSIKGEGIKFTTTGPWRAEIEDVSTKASSVDWITLSQYSGDKAGDYTLTITLGLNDTGKDRKAEIKIVCGATTITIRIEQKKTTAGEEPDEPLEKYEFLISTMETENLNPVGGYTGREKFDFIYDDLNRLTEIKATGTEEDNNGSISTWESLAKVTYGDHTVSYAVYTEPEDNRRSLAGRSAATRQGDNGSLVLSERGTATLDDAGRVVSGKLEFLDDEEPSTEPYTLTYDKDGYLIGSKRLESDGSNDDYDLKWQNGGLSEVLCDFGKDWVEYTSHPNATNLDLNWFVMFTSEAMAFCTGDPNVFFAMMGYTGNRPRFLASKLYSEYSWEGGATHSSRYEYTYKLNASGNPVEIERSYLNSMTGEMDKATLYKITYRAAKKGAALRP